MQCVNVTLTAVYLGSLSTAQYYKAGHAIIASTDGYIILLMTHI
jgi:hypothetical protein